MERRPRMRKPAQRPDGRENNGYNEERNQRLGGYSRTRTRPQSARNAGMAARNGRGRTAAAETGSGRSYYDFTLIFLIICLCSFGLIMLYSVTAYSDRLVIGNAFASTFKQLRLVAAGIAIMIALSFCDYHWLAKVGWFAYIFALFLSIITLFVGVESHGKRRWLKVPIINIQFQPAELAKVALIIILAMIICNLGKKINKWYMYVVFLGIIGIQTLPIIKENLSSGIIIFMIGVIMMFVAAKKKWPFFLAAALLFIAVFAALKFHLLEHVLQEYQMDRINAWLYPMRYKDDEAYQTVQGLYAIASGGFTGKGLGQSIQKLGYLPEAQNDMIFAIICEELGLFGASLVILLFGMMIWRLMIIANNAPDLFGSMLTVGVMAHISIQVIFNIAVATSVMPNTGVGLPFISSGGTAVWILMAEMAIVLSVSRQIRS